MMASAMMQTSSGTGTVSDLAPGKQLLCLVQGCGSGSGLDPDSIGSLDPDPDLESGSGSGSRRANMTHKSRKNV
jgi:hypothetical protein